MIKAAGYCRVSSEGQAADGTSLEAQTERITKKAKDERYELIGIFSDVYTGATNDRPGWTKLIEAAKAKEFTALIFTRLDRLGRSLTNVLESWNFLVEKLNIEMVSLDDPAIVTKGVGGKIIRSVLALVAEVERDLIRERTQGGRMRRWKANETFLGSIPFGYRKKRLPGSDRFIPGECEEDPETGPIYRKMIDYYLHRRMSLADVAIQLNREGLKSPGVLRGTKKPSSAKWSPQAVQHIVRNSVYTGEIIYNRIARDEQGRKMVIGGSAPIGADLKKPRAKKNEGRQYVEKPKTEWLTKKFPALITTRQFEAVQKRLNTRRRRPLHQSEFYKDHFLLSSMLFCGECGSQMGKIVRVSKDRKPRRWQYICHAHAKGTKDREFYKVKDCALKRCDANQIDNEAWNQVVKLLANPSKYAAAFLKDQPIGELEEQKARLALQMKDIEGRIEKGFSYIQSVTDQDRRVRYEGMQKKLENEALTIESELKTIAEKLDVQRHKRKRLGEFKRGIADRVGFKDKAIFTAFLNHLSFDDRRRITEGLISPESGGRIKVGYIRPQDFLDDRELAKIPKKDWTRPLKDRELCINMEFDVDIEKIEAIITSLDMSKYEFGPFPVHKKKPVYRFDPDRTG